MLGIIFEVFEEIVATSGHWNDQDITHLQSERQRMFSDIEFHLQKFRYCWLDY